MIPVVVRKLTLLPMVTISVAAEEAAQAAAEAEAQAAVDSAVSMVEFDEAHDTQMGLHSYEGPPGLDSGALAQQRARNFVARNVLDRT